MSILATQYPVYQRAMRIISSITNAYPAVVTTSFAHQYETGMIVRLNIPKGFGMQEANSKYGKIVVTSSTAFTIDLDTTYFDPYVISAVFPYSYQSGQVTPMGEINTMLTSATQNVLPYSS